MTIISNSKQFIFVHLHKCGGTSIEAAYSKHARWNDLVIGSTPLGEQLQHIYKELHGLHKHNTARDIRDIVGPDVWANYWTVSLVRHPLRIYESFYGWISLIVERYLEKHGITREEFARRFQRGEIVEPLAAWGSTRAYAESNNFNEFMDVVLAKELLPKSLTSRLSDEDHVIVDNVYKLEDSEKLQQDFEERTSIRLERLHLNKGKPLTYEWDQRHVEEIHKRFEIDFRTFGYE